MKRALVAAITRLFVRPFRRHVPPRKQVAILVPVSPRSRLSEDEQISLQHLLHHLGAYDKFLLVPKGMDIGFEGLETRYYPQRFFGSASAHSRLLGSRWFYRGFLDYEYVFFYHLDSLALSDQLSKWCEHGIDYIGPPWIRCPDSPWVKCSRVGNGGFTLLRVESAIKALTNRYLAKPAWFWYDAMNATAPRWLFDWIGRVVSAGPSPRILRRIHDEWLASENSATHNRNNDIFWSDDAVTYHPEFKVATLEEGLRFAFEVAPRTCYEINGRRLPFGCHAWARYDRAFWEPFLISARRDETTSIHL